MMAKVKLIDPMPIQVSFVNRLRADGEIIRMRIVQSENEIQLTKEQAHTLVNQILGKLP